MTWNWQHSSWPDFHFDPRVLAEAEALFLHWSGRALGLQTAAATVGMHEPHDQMRVQVELLTQEAEETSSIEGEVLDRASVQSSIQRALGVAADRVRSGPAEEGIAYMLVEVIRSYQEPLHHEDLFRWHGLLCAGRRDLSEVGSYRSSDSPMRIVSGRVDKPRVHFEAPPSARVASEMERFVDWFNSTQEAGGPGRPSLLPLARAGLTHLHFESIHPFEDGNGRLGRVLIDKAIAQRLGHPTMLAISRVLRAHQRDYYLHLEQSSHGLDATDWLRWFAAMCLRAQLWTSALLELAIFKNRVFAEHDTHLNDRQRKCLRRLFESEPSGFVGGMTSGKYAALTRASAATATRDLAQLVERGLLVREGSKRGTRYRLQTPVREIPQIVISSTGKVEGLKDRRAP